MRPILRKLRGALGTALTWAVGWAVLGFSFFTFASVMASLPDEFPFWEYALSVAFTWALNGLVGGALFSGALAIIHRRRTLGELKPAWVGLWGGLAGVLISMPLIASVVAAGPDLGVGTLETAGMIVFGASVYGGIGAATAAGTVLLAQKGTKEIESSDPDQLLTSHR